VTSRLADGPRGPVARGATAFFAVALLIAGVLQASVAAALSDTETPPATPPELLLVDAGESPYVLVRTADAPSEVAISVGGNDAETGVPVAIGDSSLPIQTTIVIDNSAASSEQLTSFISAAQAYIDGAGENENISVWTTGGVSRLRVGLNNDHQRTSEIVSGIVTAAGTSILYDSIRDSAMELVGTGSGATNVIVFAGAIDGGSVATVEEARGAVQAVDASAFVVATTDVVAATMSNLVSSTYGGAFAAAEDPAEIAGYGTSVSEVIGGTWMIPFDSEQIIDGNQLTVTIDGTSIRASYAAGSVASGRALAPFTELGDGGVPGFGFLSGDTGRVVGLLLGAIAAGLGAYAVVLLLQKDESVLSSVLQAYNDPQANAAVEAEADEAGSSRHALLRRAFELSENLAERQGTLSRIEGTLEQAALPLRAGEALTAAVGIAVSFAVIGLLVTGSLPGMLVSLIIGTLIPGFAVRVKASRRRKAFMGQLPDTLQLLSSTLKAGFSFMQGIEAVSKEIEEPMGGELRRIVTEAQLGRPIEEAMDASAERMNSPDFSWAVMAVKIQREVGGNLSELLLTVAETMTERERLRRDISSLTAEGKMSAIVLGALPILLGMAMWAMNPEYINILFTDSFGQVILGMSIFAVFAGFAWMRKIINIDI
jgi:tight adherence protein B